MSRYLLVTLLIGLPLSTALAHEAVEGEPVAARVITTDLVEAEYAYELAKLSIQQYRQVTLLQQRRQLDEQIQLARREMRLLERSLRDYRPFLQAGEFSPVRTAADSHELALLVVQSHYRQLRDARINQVRYTRQNYQLLRLEVLKAATRLAEVKRSLVTE